MGTSLCQDTAGVAALNLLVSQARDMLHPCPQALLSLTPLPVSHRQQHQVLEIFVEPMRLPEEEDRQCHQSI